ncbi:hypothetical protein [Treponema pectinovorum]|uniref:hypothetical protein n=1 Tax=Treponema pectinovorum TaxID=164 RepID=UPI0011CBA93F|nr:hypothetical protein [Treponema pectinovorum]
MNKFSGKIRFYFVLAAIFLTFSSKASAELVSSSVFNYSIDLPEMFEIADCSSDERSVLFEHRLLSVQIIIRVWEGEKYNSSDLALSSTVEKLSGNAEISKIRWRNADCSIAKFTTDEKAIGQKTSGWGICAPLQKTNDFLTVLCFCPQEKFHDIEQFMLSILDCVMIDRASFAEAGIITNFAFPKTQNQKVELKIDGKNISTSLDKDDSEANQFVIDREFEVFKIFINQKCWKEAWQRFYRIIAKDAAGRLKKAAFDIYTNLYDSLSEQEKKDSQALIAQKLLTWTQNLEYQRRSTTKDKADLLNIPDTLLGKGSDCDSRSMLLMCLYKNMDIDSIMLISNTYSHAMVAAFLEGKLGQAYNLDKKDYLFGETTAQNLTFGMISGDMQDRSKWIPVELYE